MMNNDIFCKVEEEKSEYRLTWPAHQPGVCTIAGQWRRNEQGEIEAWYSAAQLRDALAAMQAAQDTKGE